MTKNTLENRLEKDQETKSNYRKWAFRFFAYAIIANLGVFFKVINFVDFFHSKEALARDLLFLSIIIIICLIAGSIFAVLMYKNNEEKNYQYKFSIWGIPILIILTILGNIF